MFTNWPTGADPDTLTPVLYCPVVAIGANVRTAPPQDTPEDAADVMRMMESAIAAGAIDGGNDPAEVLAAVPRSIIGIPLVMLSATTEQIHAFVVATFLTDVEATIDGVEAGMAMAAARAAHPSSN